MTKIVPDAKRQLEQLWRAAFGEPPAIEAEPSITAQVLVRCLPEAGPYELGQSSPGGGRPAAGRDGG